MLLLTNATLAKCHSSRQCPNSSYMAKCNFEYVLCPQTKQLNSYPLCHISQVFPFLAASLNTVIWVFLIPLFLYSRFHNCKIYHKFSIVLNHLLQNTISTKRKIHVFQLSTPQWDFQVFDSWQFCIQTSSFPLVPTPVWNGPLHIHLSRVSCLTSVQRASLLLELLWGRVSLKNII